MARVADRARILGSTCSAGHDHAMNALGRNAVLMSAATDAIIVIDEKSTILEVNKAAEDMFGYPQGEMLGRNLSELQAAPLRSRHAAAVDRYRRTGERRVSWKGAAVTARHRSGREFPVEISFGEFTEDGQQRFLGIMRDTSERARLESELRQAQKMEALGLLAGGIAHDFNNILAAIVGYTHLAESAVAPQHQARADLAHIRDAADRGIDLTRQLLTFSRRELVEPVLLDPGATLHSLTPLLEQVLGPSVAFVLDAAVGQFTIRMDPTHFDQILINLAANARDAMPGGGTLSVRLSTEERAAAAATGAAVPASHGWMLLTVTDTGVGMAPETRDHIFDPFFTTKDAEHGTGLGLATVHGIVQAAGGSISVESRRGAGSTFRVSLPRCVAPLSEQRAIQAPNAVSGRPEVLLVLTAPAAQVSAARILDRAGCVVIAASDRASAIDLAEAPGSIALLITDLSLPDGPGPSAAFAVRRHHPTMPILYVAGPSRARPGKVRIGDPPGEVIAVPFSATDLVARVRTLLDQSRDGGPRDRAECRHAIGDHEACMSHASA